MKTKHHYHDAELIGCAHSRRDSTLTLTFGCTDGITPKLLLSGINSFRINDFTHQNVVSRLLISPSHMFAPGEIRNYVNWVDSQHDYRAAMTEVKAQTIEAAIVAGEFMLVVLEPSVGAEVVVLCRAIEETS